MVILEEDITNKFDSNHLGETKQAKKAKKTKYRKEDKIPSKLTKLQEVIPNLVKTIGKIRN